MHKLLFVFFILLTLIAKAQNILFVGNSLSYSNNMPKILECIGQEYDLNIKTKCLCKPNYAIIDHLNEGELQKILNTKPYNYIIIQQGPSSQEQGRRMLIEDGAKVNELAKKHNAKLGYYMVWPSKYYYHTFEKVIANYTEGAKTNKALLFPVGRIWKAYENRGGYTLLYDSDNFHPSKAGSFLAALTIFRKLYPNKSIENLNYNRFKKWTLNEKSFKKIIELVN